MPQCNYTQHQTELWLAKSLFLLRKNFRARSWSKEVSKMVTECVASYEHEEAHLVSSGPAGKGVVAVSEARQNRVRPVVRPRGGFPRGFLPVLLLG
jgi:hypothetical protein